MVKVLQLKFVRSDAADLMRAVSFFVSYPTPFEGWGHGGRPWSPRSRATL